MRLRSTSAFAPWIPDLWDATPGPASSLVRKLLPVDVRRAPESGVADRSAAPGSLYKVDTASSVFSRGAWRDNPGTEFSLRSADGGLREPDPGGRSRDSVLPTS